MKYSKSSKQQGFSIIELMVALLIGMILMGGAVSIFIANKNTNRMVTELSRMQEAGRFIIDYMSEEIRLAGYYGCTSRFEKDAPETVELNEMTITGSPYEFTENFVVAGVHGLNGEDRGQFTPKVPVNLFHALYDINGVKGKKVINETDVINIQRSSACQVPLIKPTDTGAGNNFGIGAKFEIYSDDCKFRKDYTVMISDCKTADAFTIEDPANNLTVIQHSKDLNEAGHGFIAENYGIDAHASRLHSNTFFVGMTGRKYDIKDKSGNEVFKPALYVASWAPNDQPGLDSTDYKIEELVEGVQDMQILYGIDSSGDEYVDSYVKADMVNDWSNVRNVRIHIFMQSKDLITTEALPFTFDKKDLNPKDLNPKNDRRLRLMFSTTIALRNRLS